MATNNKNLKYGTLYERRVRAMTVFSFFLLCLTLIVLCSPAWSFELDRLPATSSGNAYNTNLPTQKFSTSRPASAEDSCLSLLNTVRYDASPSAAGRDRRSVGKATALGLVLGVRFALGPKEVMKTSPSGGAARLGFWQPRDVADTGSSRALAIADYRRCKSEQALKALSDWRWVR